MDSLKVRINFSLLGCLPQTARAGGRATIPTGCQDVSGEKAGFLSCFHYVTVVFSPHNPVSSVLFTEVQVEIVSNLSWKCWLP